MAVLAVLLFHAGVPFMAGGYVGVDVFFVVSGYLITSLLVSERTSEGRVSLSEFYARRARRILPMASLVAVATLIASWVWLEPLRLRGLATDVLGVASFSSNLIFGGRGADYLQSSLPPSPLQHYWSLGVEEQFYLVWPALIVLVCWRATSRRSVIRRVGVTSAVVGVASFLACMALMDTSAAWAFFSPHTRAFELAAGALVAALPAPTARLDKMVSSWAAWCGLIVIGATVVLFDETTRFPGPWAIVPVVATALVVRGGEATRVAPDVVLRLAPLQWLGSRSYSAYLWHWPVLIIGAAGLSREFTVAEGMVCIGIALALSEISYRLVEDPIRINRAIRGTRALALGVSLVAIVGGSGVLAANNPPIMAGAGNAAEPTLVSTTTVPATSGVGATTTMPATSGVGATTTVPVVPRLPGEGVPIPAIIEAATMTGLPANLTPSLGSVFGDEPSIYKDGCHASFSSVSPKHCVFGDRRSPVVIGLYGDSHAAEWFPTFAKVAEQRKWKLITYTKRGCPPADIPTYSKVLGKVYTECGPWRRAVLKKMARDGVDVVFVGSFDRLLAAATRLPVWQKDWRAGLQGTVDALRRIGTVPVLIEDTPFPGRDIPTCLSASYTNITICAPVTGSAYRSDMTEMRRDFQAAGVDVLWVRHWFCSRSTCPPVVGNVLVYRDDNHMTVPYAELLTPLLDGAIGTFVASHASPDTSSIG